MFPLNDTEPNRYSAFPVMTFFIIVLNTVVLMFEYALGAQDVGDLFGFYRLYGSVPQLILNREGLGAVSAITSTFVHAGLFHLLSNMWALWVFGRRVEDACGPWRFLGYYLLAGLCSDLLSTIVRSQLGRADIPGVGASGAVFGVMGAYLLLFPGGRIRTFIMLWFIPMFPKVRALWVILYYLVVQYISAYNVLFNDRGFYVNYWAHLGGFFACLLIFLFLSPEAFERYWNDQPV